MANPQFYTEVSLIEDADYQPPCVEQAEPQGEEEEETEGEENCPLPILAPSGTHLEILHSEQRSREQSLERLRDLLDKQIGTIIEEMFQLLDN